MSSDRIQLVRAYALETALRGERIALVDLAWKEIRPEFEPKRSQARKAIMPMSTSATTASKIRCQRGRLGGGASGWALVLPFGGGVARRRLMIRRSTRR